ncbi:hypothetical protein Tco_1019023 [Tanacetum coccineum]|uniref:Reverse transcriptase domain-containing protein n=1 Tax=Tanacetum coccineum TaxID=301880 RepID=A0ABQ5FW02_9ASTR
MCKLSQRMIDFVMTVRQDTNEIYRRLDDAQDDRLRCKGLTKQIVSVIPKGLAIWVVLVDLHSKDESGKWFKREDRKVFVSDNATLVIPMKELRLDDKLNFVEEPVKIMDREVKKLKQSHIPIVKVRWNSKRGPKFTWECEDQIRAKYPHLFSNITPASN